MSNTEQETKIKDENSTTQVKEGKIKHFEENFFEIDDDNHLSGYEAFFIFMVCNVLGYCIEMVWCYIKNGVWESRQSLVFGPFGLIYGLGGILLSYLLYKDIARKWYYIFIKSFFWCSVAEYIASLGEEIVFNHVSWDYSAMPLNINGRVCALYSLFWGLLGLIWCKLIYPNFMWLIHKIPIRPGKVAFWIIFIFMIVDIVLSAEAVNRHNERADNVPASGIVDETMDEWFDDDFLHDVYPNAVVVEE